MENCRYKFTDEEVYDHISEELYEEYDDLTVRALKRSSSVSCGLSICGLQASQTKLNCDPVQYGRARKGFDRVELRSRYELRIHKLQRKIEILYQDSWVKNDA